MAQAPATVKSGEMAQAPKMKIAEEVKNIEENKTLNTPTKNAPSINIPTGSPSQQVGTPTGENSARAGLEAPQLTKAQKKKLREKKNKLINSIKEQVGKGMTEENAKEVAEKWIKIADLD